MRITSPRSIVFGKRKCAFYPYTALLRLPTLMFLSQFLQGDRQNPQAAKAVQRLRTPTLESWFTALTTLAKQLFPLVPGQAVAFTPWDQGGPFAPGLVAASRFEMGRAHPSTAVVAGTDPSIGHDHSPSRRAPDAGAAGPVRL
jgi:hypothetical protein